MNQINGYVIDQQYTSDYHHAYAPAWLDYVALLNQVAPPPRTAGRFRFCDLGCGFGMTALTLAAANPQAEIHGIDFMAEHIDVAQKLATDAGLGNVQFSRMAFADALEQPFEPFDYIVAHGVYSWVSAEVRAEVVAFIRRHLKPGGLVYVSYNAMPGCADILALQKLISHLGASGNGAGSERVMQAFGQLEQLRVLGARALVGRPGLDDRLQSIAGEDPRYLAHEYLHSVWEPRYFADVAAEMLCADVTFIGSATLFANEPRFLMNTEQQAFVAAGADPIERQMLQDYMLDTSFRRDVWARQPSQLSADEALRRLAQMPFMLQVAPDAVQYVVQVGFAQLNIDSPIARNLVKALAEGVKTITQLLSRWDMMAASQQEVRDLLFVLACSGQVTPVEQDKIATDSRLNDVLRAAAYPCKAMATPFGVGLELELPELILAMRPKDSSIAVEDYLRNELQRTGRSIDTVEIAACIGSYQARRARVIQSIHPVGHI